jgi:hypothetical protein
VITQKLRSAAPGAVRDAAFLAGLVLVGFGLYIVYLPAALVFAGASLSWLAYITTPSEQ